MRALLNALQAGNRSGTGRYAGELARALAAPEADFHFDVLWPEGVEHPPAGPHVRVLPISGGALRRLWTDHAAIRRIARETSASVVHYPANIGPAIAPEGLVVTVHDCSFFREPAWFRRDRAWYYRLFVARGLRGARRVIVDSQATAADVEEWLHVPHDCIDVIPLGVGAMFRPMDAAAQDAARRRHGLPGAYFLYVGTLEPRKNLPRIIAAWAQATAHGGPDLVIAGRRGWKTGALDAAIAECPRRDCIHLVGFLPQTDLPAVISAAVAFVWPTLLEGFGLPVLEAMACGVPVITSDRSSLPELTGDAALLVHPEHIEDIAAAMRRLMEDAALRQSLRDKGMARAALFTWERTARLTLDAYRRAAEQGQPVHFDTA